MYFAVNKKKHWFISLPAVFLTMICLTYIFVAPVKAGGMNLSKDLSLFLGVLFTVIISVLWYIYYKKNLKNFGTI